MKPLDFGGEGVTGSVNADGRLIALNFYHPQQGYVTLTSAEPFPEGERYNPPMVRAYRNGLAHLDGFGARFAAPIVARSFSLIESAIPRIDLQVASVGARAASLQTTGDISCVTCASGRGAVQTITMPPNLRLRWGGRLCLQRCAYTQLTEGGPLPMPPLKMRIFCQDGLLIIHNPEIDAAVAIAGLTAMCDAQDAETLVELILPLASDTHLTLAYGVGQTADEAAANARWLRDHHDTQAAISHWRGVTAGLPDDPLARRGINYSLMMAIPVGEGTCLITDHMLLPLSWNRDAYFMARALLSAGQPEVVRRHLLWMFETAERPDGAWARCYTANGSVKDPAFQLDQQLYPLLEFADYMLETGDQAVYARLLPSVKATLAGLEARRSGDSLLFATDETPADDPIALPYHLSSHILMWHTMTQLNRIGAAGDWAERLAPLRETIQQTFVAQHQGRAIYAYAADGAGHFHFYHDANDFPLALAPAWGYVPPDDPVWAATVAFAFSDDNHGGVYAGHLGSVHTPAPWALGDIQEMVIARALKDPAREEKAWASLRAAAQPDGALPEAYDATTGEVVSRYWFAWPSAALACVVLDAFKQ